MPRRSRQKEQSRLSPFLTTAVTFGGFLHVVPWALGVICSPQNPASPYHVGRFYPHFTHEANEASKVDSLALGARKLFIRWLELHPRGSFGTQTPA